MSDTFSMELCGSKGAWQIVPEGCDGIDLEAVGAKMSLTVMRWGFARA